MEKVDYLIIGGGIAGTTAAETIRKNDRQGSIAIVSDEPHRLYARINLSKANFFLGRLPQDLIWLKKGPWYGENNITLLTGKKAVGLEPSKKEVALDDGTKIGYEKLLLALGGKPNKLNVPGAEKSGVSYLRTLDDTHAIMIEAKSAKRAVVIGGGFIGFEICEMLKLAGIEVTLVIREPHYWQPLLDEASGRMIEAALENGGVKVLRNAEVKEISGDEEIREMMLQNGARIPCDLVIIGVGIHAPVAWLKDSGLELGRGIMTNEYLETNVPDAWAAGDAAEFEDLLLKEKIQLGNWTNAQMQGRVAGKNMTGEREPFRLVSAYTTRGFDLSIAFVGDVRALTDRKVIPRGSPEINSYARLISRDDAIIGATLINRTQELGIISRLIEKNIDVADKEKELGNPETNLRKFLQ